MNLHKTATRLQTALCLYGKKVTIEQRQAWSEKTQRMVTKYIVRERMKVAGKDKSVTRVESYQMAEVVKTLAALLQEVSGGA